MYPLRNMAFCSVLFTAPPDHGRNTMFTVQFSSTALTVPEFIGPFETEDDAQDFCDERNGSLQLAGIPSFAACYFLIN